VPVAGVPDAFSIRDADPSRVKLYFDGFEVPALVYGGRALWFGGMSHVRTFDEGMDLGYAGTAGLEAVTDTRPRGGELDITPMDASVMATVPGFVGGIRVGYFTPTRGRSLTLDASDQPVDVQERLDWRLSAHWTLTASALALFNTPQEFARIIARAAYDTRETHGVIAASASDHTIDTRAEVRHDLRDVGGLSVLELQAGETTTIRDDNTFDGGAWAGLAALIAKSAGFSGGVRADIFDHQVALSPRAGLAASFGGLGVGVIATASRIAQVDRDVTPERATLVVARVTRRVRGLYETIDAYYIDRSRILVDGKATSVGTAYGIEERIQGTWAAWTVYAAAALATATRADRLTAPDHPADHDVPLRFDLLASWVSGDWRLGARVQGRSGLPYTPVVGAVYDGDTDSYSPLDGKVNANRAPWRRQLDLRVDHRWGRHLRAYLDVALDGGVLGYTYNYDYSQKLEVRAPLVLPWLGIVGNL
jgi:hypothetical protein